MAIPLPSSGSIIGRDWLCEHGIEEHEASREHAQLTRAGGIVMIKDLGSRNGTWVNGYALTAGENVQLEDGAVLRMGSTLLVYREALSGSLEPAPPVGAMIGPYGLRGVAAAVAALGPAPSPTVLIEGETGAGKELAAAAVAAASGRARHYAAVNVAGVAAGVFESQLFGHVAGAFSGAQQASKGVLMAHEGGAVFMDEIGELPLELQPKLLRVLENREVLPVGADKPVKIDVMIIAATNRDLEHMVDEGKFRQDLLARLSHARIELPPLRDRAEDIVAIARAWAEQHGVVIDGAGTEVEAVERLLRDAWTYNVRGLVAALGEIKRVDPEPGFRLWAVSKVLGPLPDSVGAPLTGQRVRAALDACGGSEVRASRHLGVTRGRLRRFLGKG